MIVGLTGENAAGKGTVAEILISEGFEYRSLSDAIRDELARQGLPPTREALTATGNALRQQFGAGALASRILEGLSQHGRYVVDSIRNPAEVQVLRGSKRPFVLVHVTAQPTVRFERIQQRNRPGDSVSFDAFTAQEQREWQSEDPAKQQIRATVALSDITIDNSGSLQALKKALQEALPLAFRGIHRQ